MEWGAIAFSHMPRDTVKKTKTRGFPGGPVVEPPPCDARDTGLILVWEDATCQGATKPGYHKYCICALRARRLQLPSLLTLQPVFRNKRSHSNERPVHSNREGPPLAAIRENPCAAMKTHCSQ